MNAEVEIASEKAAPPTRIERAEGTTVTEKYLARLCEKTFLSLWSYPGVFRDQGKKGSGDGKEICDLLVVFDNDVIIFSDKHCTLAALGKLQRNWQRWFKNAIWQSAKQAWGAERWIREQPNRIFLDKQCTQPLPVPLPPPQHARFHLVVIAHGISDRIKASFPNGSGSLFLDSSIRGIEAHTMPFFCGDVAPQKTLIHILNEDSLHTVMMTRDTIRDFVGYLSAREKLLRGSVRISTTGEEQLLAFYLKNVNEKQEHDFIFPSESGKEPNIIYLPEGHWEGFQQAPERLAQIEADKVSYAWDRLIERFNFYALRGEQYFVTDGGLSDSERVLRFMAREPRWKRRYLAKSLLEMLQTTPTDKQRLRVLPPVLDGDPYYVFLLVPVLHTKSKDEYRTIRRKLLESCCIVAKAKYPDAQAVVGIATESGMENGGRSEDCLYLDAREWTDEMQSHALELQNKLGILNQPRQIREHLQEYPSVPPVSGKIKNPRNKPCPCGSGKKYKRCCLLAAQTK